VVAVGVAMGGQAQAAKWTFTPGIGATEAFTDNFGLRTESQDRVSEFVTTVTPSIGVRGAGGRVNLALDYAYERLFHYRLSERNDGRNTMNATASAEVWDKSIFIDGSAQISQQIANTLGPVSQSQANLNANRTETRSYTIGPRFLHHFGTWAETVSTIKRTVTTTDQNEDTTNTTTAPLTTATGSPLIQDSQTAQSHFVMNSGRRFTQLLWSVTADQTRISRERAPHHKDTLGRVDLTYVVARNFSLLGGFGLQWIDDASLTSEPSGPIWTVGAQYRPGPRTTLQANYNHQYDSNFFTYSGTYLVSPRTTLTFAHNQSVRTTEQTLQESLAFLIVDQNGQIIDSRTGLPPNSSFNPAGLQEETVRLKTWTAGANSTSGRNTYGIQFSRTITLTERTGEEITQDNVAVSYSRQLTRRLSGRLSANYRIAESTNTGGGVVAPSTSTTSLTGTSTTNLLLSAGLSYILAPETNVDFTLNSSRFNTDLEGANTRENAASISLRRTF
jgi:hypothetical protein